MPISRLIPLVLLAFLPSCAAHFEETRLAGSAKDAVSLDPPQCAAIDAAHRNWSAAAASAAVLGGASGLSAIPVTGRDARIGILSGAAALGAFAAIAGVESNSFAADWVRECGATGTPEQKADLDALERAKKEAP